MQFEAQPGCMKERTISRGLAAEGGEAAGFQTAEKGGGIRCVCKGMHGYACCYE